MVRSIPGWSRVLLLLSIGWLSLSVQAESELWVLDVSQVLHLQDERRVDIPLRPPSVGTAIIYRTRNACTDRDYAEMDEYLRLKFFNQDWVQGWVEQTHCLFSWRANAAARWLNHWFRGPGMANESTEASWLLTLRNAVGWDQIQGQYVSRSISSEIQLPAMEKRLSLLIESNEQAINPNQIGVPAPLQQQSRAINAGAVALQWRSTIKELSGFSVDAGVRSGPEVFLRSQYFKSIALGSWWTLHLHQAFVEGSMTRAESYSEASLERPVGYGYLFRLSTTWDWQQPEQSLGEQWVHALSLTHTMNDGSVLSEGLSVAGISSPQFHYLNWGPGLTYHRRFWRPWLYYEIRPAYTRVFEAPGPNINVPVSYFLAGHLVPMVLVQPTWQERWIFSTEIALGMEFGR